MSHRTYFKIKIQGFDIKWSLFEIASINCLRKVETEAKINEQNKSDVDPNKFRLNYNATFLTDSHLGDLTKSQTSVNMNLSIKNVSWWKHTRSSSSWFLSQRIQKHLIGLQNFYVNKVLVFSSVKMDTGAKLLLKVHSFVYCMFHQMYKMPVFVLVLTVFQWQGHQFSKITYCSMN